MIHVRHRSASGRADEYWELDSSRILASIRHSAGSLALDAHVCSYGIPIFGAHPIVRIDDETWCVHPVRFIREWPGGIEALRAINCAVGDVLGHGVQLVLAQSPSHVNAELEKL